ncbi:MAG TPA: hypothetical protein PLO19_02685 [Candidatus Cryosericum sp.]|nr:hypothetical protein [Candidatus Cryosericum sp.]HPS69633.1 hypothetical protein [Candidatus Cryosericum sp.]
MSDIPTVPEPQDTTSVRSETSTKINVWLRVLPRQAGERLHKLESLFVRTALGDLLTLAATPAERPSFQLSSNRAELIPGNSVTRSWTVFTEALATTNNAAAFHIQAHLEKRIPEQTGLGAGSGDAAACLLALNDLHGHPFTPTALTLLASRIGSDVPFLTALMPAASVQGTGDFLTAVPKLPQLWACVVLPPFKVDTAAAYGALDRVIASTGAAAVEPTVSMEEVVAALQGSVRLPAGTHAPRLNAFETVLGDYRALYQEVRDILWAGGARVAGLSGSGSAMFGVYESRATASAVARDLQQRLTSCQAMVAKLG